LHMGGGLGPPSKSFQALGVGFDTETEVSPNALGLCEGSSFGPGFHGTSSLSSVVRSIGSFRLALKKAASEACLPSEPELERFCFDEDLEDGRPLRRSNSPVLARFKPADDCMAGARDLLSPSVLPASSVLALHLFSSLGGECSSDPNDESLRLAKKCPNLA